MIRIFYDSTCETDINSMIMMIDNEFALLHGTLSLV